MRLERESEAIREVYPSEYADLAVFVTDLGGVSVVLVLVAVLYWTTRRRETALVASYAVAGVGVVLLLKTILGMPRPPEEVFLVPMEDDPYGFPSGHAFAAILVYGGLLLTHDRHREPFAVGVVATLVVVISLSRVVLGFHYFGDVIVGAIGGAAFLLVMHALVDGEPRTGFGIAIAVAIPALYVSGGDPYGLVALGGGIGGLLATAWFDAIPDRCSRVRCMVLVVVGLGFVFVMWAVESTVATSGPAVVVLYALLFAGILLAPAAVDRLEIGPFVAVR